MKAALALVLALGITGCTPDGPPPSGQTGALTIFAASSLKDLLDDVGRAWTRQTSQPVRIQFEASSTLARQIVEGAPADLFLSAAPEWVAQVKALDRFDWLSNHLVLVVAKDSPKVEPRAVESLALADEQVPAGKYAKAALAALGLGLPRRTLYGSNVRDVLSKVSQGGAQAGIVYETDAAIDPGVRISYTFAPESYPRILYVAGLLTRKGQGFYQALKEPWVRNLARRYGFIDLR
ncbi:MAG TPA: molybdate ABC transporter substrate-binding protein [Planctomycetota bacterium]|nr:molybdate ABC transporter substrate-binding protein [Planctomycetota bacterium]